MSEKMKPEAPVIFDEDTVKRVAHLARVELSAAEVKLFTSQLGTILHYVESLSELNTDGVEPLNNPTIAHEVPTAFHDDLVVPGPGAEAMTGCAPDHLMENFKVPQVIVQVGVGADE